MSWAVCLPKVCIHRPFRPSCTSVLFAPQSRRNRLISKVCPSISGHGARAAGPPPIVPMRSVISWRFGSVYIMTRRDGTISSVSPTSVNLPFAGPRAGRNDYFRSARKQMLLGDLTTTPAIRRTVGSGRKLAANRMQLSLSWLAETSQRPHGENPKSRGFLPPQGNVRRRLIDPVRESSRNMEIESSPRLVTPK